MKQLFQYLQENGAVKKLMIIAAVAIFIAVAGYAMYLSAGNALDSIINSAI